MPCAIMTTPSKMRRANVGLPMSARSCLRVERETCQPLPRSPTIESLGTRTFSRNTSLKSASPVICRRGRTSMPGDFMSMSM